MTRKSLKSEAGFTYIAALVMVVIMGIMSAKAAEVWKTTMKRERETELLYAGAQVRDAMQRWYHVTNPAPGMQVTVPAGVPPLKQLKDLLKDPNVAGTKKYLRWPYQYDPMGKDPTKKEEWDVIRDGAKIVGVKSKSEAEPLKQDNFPDDFADFAGKKKYNEWEFRFDHVAPKKNEGPRIDLNNKK